MNRSLQPIVEPLLRWFETNKRELPWRRDRDPYHVWISEIMLQQTRIEAVIRYYTRFTDALPDVAALSTVDDDRLMKLWEGLGYYSRARNLKKAAQMVMQDFGGSFPTSYAQIVTLPGIGEYTAGAIASICFDEPVAAVDGNVLRVLARVTADRSNVLLPQTKKQVSAALTEIMPPQSGAFNEALMELGELVCLPNGVPDCAHCPVQEHCRAFREGLTEELPVRVKKLRRTRSEKTVLIIRTPDDRTAVEKRPDSGLLSGMYQLPCIDGYYSDEELKERLSAWGLTVTSLAFSKSAKHVFTHIDWYMKAYAVAVAEPTDRFFWATEDELAQAYPLPTAFRKLLSE